MDLDFGESIIGLVIRLAPDGHSRGVPTLRIPTRAACGSSAAIGGRATYPLLADAMSPAFHPLPATFGLCPNPKERITERCSRSPEQSWPSREHPQLHRDDRSVNRRPHTQGSQQRFSPSPSLLPQSPNVPSRCCISSPFSGG